MKPLASRPAPGAITRLVAFGAFLLVLLGFQPTPALAGREGKAKKPKVQATPTPTPTPDPDATPEGAPASKEIPIPLPIGDKSMRLKIPSFGDTGQMLSQLMAMQAKRIDADHMELQGTKIDLNQADGKSDYHIEIPTSIFNLKTRIITSDQPVVIRTQEFELTGEKMSFNTVEKSGELLGNVHMVIHNLKKTAGVTSPAP